RFVLALREKRDQDGGGGNRDGFPGPHEVIVHGRVGGVTGQRGGAFGGPAPAPQIQSRMADVSVAEIDQALEAPAARIDKGVRRTGVGVQSEKLLRFGQGRQCAFPQRFKWNLQRPRAPIPLKPPGYYIEVFGQAPFEVARGAVGGEVSAVVKWLLRD